MMDHKQLISLLDTTNTSMHQEQAISRRGILLGIAGLVVTGCGQQPISTSPSANSASRTTPATTGGSTAEGSTQAASTTSPSPSAGTTLLTYKGHSSNVTAVGWSPDGRRIASASIDTTVQIWDASTGKTLLIYRGHSTPVNALAWSPDGKYLASGAGDYNQKSQNTVQVWKADTGQMLVTYTDHTAPITTLAWLPDGTRIISASDDGKAHIWDALSGKRLLTVPGIKAVGAYVNPNSFVRISTLAVSPDGQQIVIGTGDVASGGVPDQHPVKIYQSQTGHELLTYHNKIGGVWALSWSPDGGSIAMSQHTHSIEIWNATSGKDITKLPALNAAVLALAWSPDGKHLASGGGSLQAVENDNQAQIWDIARKKVTIYLGHKLTISSLSWSPDGTRVATASRDRTVQVWQAV